MRFIFIFSLFFFFSYSLKSQSDIRQILSNATNYNEAVEQAEAYFKNKHGDKTAAELCSGEFRDSDYVKFMRWKAYWGGHLNPDGTLGDPTAYFKENFNKSISSDFEDIEWTNLSYENYIVGQIGMGRTSSIGFHPTDANTFYVGAAIGGIWKTTDGGLSYTPLGDDLPFLALSQIVVNQDNPEIIYIALSDHLWYGPPSIGVYKSIDGGETWTSTALSFDFDQNKRIYWIDADPSDPNHMLVGTENGLYRTLDGFETVTLINSLNTSDVKFHPTDSSIAYQATTTGKFYRSSDGGESFDFIQNMGNASTRIALSNIDSDKVYVRIGDKFRKSTDAGLTFSSDVSLPEGGGILMFSPLSDSTLITGSFELYKSDDDGENFSVKTDWLGWNGLPLVHVDHRNAFANPLQDSLIYICNDGGVYTMNVTNDSFTNLSNGLLITQFYDIAVSQTDINVIGGGSQDNGNVYRDSDGNWDDYAYTGDGMNQEIDPTNADRRYWSYQLGGLQRFYNGNNTAIAPPGEDGNGDWETPYKIDQNNPSRLICAYNKVYESNNYGNSWTAISDNLSSTDLQQLAIAPSNSNRIYVTRTNKIWVKNLATNDWTVKNLPQNNISDIEVDPIDFNTIYVSVEGYSDGNKVYRSIDAGDTWENISGSLPNVPVGAVESYNVVPGGLFVGTDAGVFYRDDSYTDWQAYGLIPNTRVEDIEIQYSGQLIRIGTHGRGVMEAPVTIGICSDGIDDADLDGICDDYDACGDFNDYLLGTACDDGDPNTTDDIYIDCDLCQGLLYLGLENYRQDFFTLYPNPNNGNFYIKGCEEKDQIEITDALGKHIIFTRQYSKGQDFIQLANFSGLAIIKINGKGYRVFIQ